MAGEEHRKLRREKRRAGNSDSCRGAAGGRRTIENRSGIACASVQDRRGVRARGIQRCARGRCPGLLVRRMAIWCGDGDAGEVLRKQVRERNDVLPAGAAEHTSRKEITVLIEWRSAFGEIRRRHLCYGAAKNRKRDL